LRLEDLVPLGAALADQRLAGLGGRVAAIADVLALGRAHIAGGLAELVVIVVEIDVAGAAVERVERIDEGGAVAGLGDGRFGVERKNCQRAHEREQAQQQFRRFRHRIR